MSTKKRIFSNDFNVIEHEGKYGLNDKKGKTILYPVYDSICELNDFDFVIEQNGKFGYAFFDEKNNVELLLPLYDVIIKKKHGLSLIKRGEYDQHIKMVCKDQHLWYDIKSHALHPNTMHIRSFIEYDLFISTKKCDYGNPPYLKKWGEDSYLEIPYDASIDILYEIPCGTVSLFVVVEEGENDEYEYCFLIAQKDGRYRFTISKKSIEELYKTIPDLMENLKCSLMNTQQWLLPRHK